MNGGQSEQLNKIKKAMKIHQIMSSDKADLNTCKNDLMKKFSMDEDEANEVALSIRDIFLPKLLNQEQISMSELPEDCLSCEMTDTDDDFANAENIVNHEEDHEADSFNDESEVDDNEIATIHIKVPKYKVKQVQDALNTIIGDDDADSMDQATNDHNNGEEDMDKKELEARKALRREILAAIADDEETKSLPRNDKAAFEYNSKAQYNEESTYDTQKGNLTDPDFKTINYNKNPVPNFDKILDTIKPGLGLDYVEKTKFDGTPENSEEYTIDFDQFKFPTQGNDNLFNNFEIASEGEISDKRTILSSNEPTELQENLLADALRLAGVEDEDLQKLTYSEAQQLYKAIKTASDVKERTSYSPDGKLPANFNNNFNKNIKEQDRKSSTEDQIEKEFKNDDNEVEDHERSGRELFSSNKDEKELYAEMIKKLMHPKLAEKEANDDDDDDEKGMDKKAKEMMIPVDVEVNTKESSSDYKKEAELYKARLKTAYAMSNKLIVAELLPADEMESYAEGMLSDGLTVTAMVRQTKLLLQSAANNAEKLASVSKGSNVRTSSSGISFNPAIRGGNSNVTSDLSGATEIQNALKNIGWTTKFNGGAED